MKMMKKERVFLLCCIFLFFTALFLWMFGVYTIGSTGNSYIIEWQFLSLCSSDWSFPVVVDYISIIFSCFVCLISGSVALFSVSYMEGEVFMKRFMLLVMAFVGAMNLLIFIPSMVTILLGWDGLGIVSFALVIYYQNKKSLAAGMLTVLANRIGDALLILGICFMVNWGEWRIGYGMTGSFSLLICFLVVVGAMTKSAQIPFSAWLPAAMAAPTPVSALVHSSTLVTAGVYLVIRFYSTLVEAQEILWFLSKVGVLTLLMAGLSACFEVDLKKIIALSTLSQLGLMMFTVGIGFPLIAIFHLLTHALFKALLFLCAGSIIHSTGDTQDGRILGSLGYLLPFSSGSLVFSSVVLCGMPFLSGFYSKDLILESAFNGFSGSLEILVMLVGAGLSLVYSLRILLISTFGQSYSGSLVSFGVESGYVLFSIFMLSMGAIMGGWMLQSVWVDVNGFSLVGLLGKTTISVVTFFGLFYGFVNFFLTQSFKKKVFSNLGWFLSSMWFMNLSSGSFLAGVSLKLGKMMHLHLDLGWMEVLGGQGVFNTLSGGISLAFTVQKENLFAHTRTFLILLVLIVIMTGIWFL